MGLFLGPLFYPSGLPVCLCTVTMLCLLIWLGNVIWNWMPPALFSLLRFALANWYLLCFHMNFGICFLVLWVMLLGLWWGWHWMCKLLLAIQPFSQCLFCLSMSKGGLATFQFVVQCIKYHKDCRSLLLALLELFLGILFLWSYQQCFPLSFSCNSLHFKFPIILFLKFHCWIFFYVAKFSSKLMIFSVCFCFLIFLLCSWLFLLGLGLNSSAWPFIPFSSHWALFTRKPLKYSPIMRLVSESVSSVAEELWSSRAVLLRGSFMLIVFLFQFAHLLFRTTLQDLRDFINEQITHDNAITITILWKGNRLWQQQH